MTYLQKFAGIAAISEGLIYIVAFVYFGVFFDYPAGGTPADQMANLKDIQLSYSMMYFLIYLVFGIVLAVLVVGLHEKLKQTNDPIVTIGSLFGVVWVGLVIASGMISNIGLDHAIGLAEKSPEKALEMWSTVSVITESLGGGNELVGGLWVLLVSVAAINVSCFTRALNWLGVFVGLAGIATVYPHDIFTEIFGVSQIIWFFWLGVCLLSQKSADQSIQKTTDE